jgi:hypothetical protein
MKGMMGQPIRDMMIATSADNGRSFTSPTRISQDNWMIDGCPHTGPSLCSSKSGLYSLWYTEGNGTGIYYSFRQNGDSEFGNRELISHLGHHPQLSVNDTRSIMAWEENSDERGKIFTTICYQVGYEASVKKGCLTPKNMNAFSPVVTQTVDGFVIAFLMETEGGVGMFTATF